MMPDAAAIPTFIAETVGAVVTAAVCALFGHLTPSPVTFCLWCGHEDAL